jgi:hypothetical protein
MDGQDNIQVDREEVDREEEDREEVDREEVDREEVDREEVDREEVDREKAGLLAVGPLEALEQLLTYQVWWGYMVQHQEAAFQSIQRWWTCWESSR